MDISGIGPMEEIQNDRKRKNTIISIYCVMYCRPENLTPWCLKKTRGSFFKYLCERLSNIEGHNTHPAEGRKQKEMKQNGYNHTKVWEVSLTGH